MTLNNGMWRKVRGSNPQGLIQPRRFSRAAQSPICLAFRAASCGNRRKFPLRNNAVKQRAPVFKSSEKARRIKAKRDFRFRKYTEFAPLQASNHGARWLGCGNDFMPTG